MVHSPSLVSRETPGSRLRSLRCRERGRAPGAGEVRNCDKLERKQLDMIIANDVAAPGIGFNSENNAVTVLWRDGEIDIGERSKAQLARELIVMIERKLHLQIA